MVDPSEYILKNAQEGKLEGIIEYCPEENSFILNVGFMNIGLFPLFEEFNNKRVRIKIEEIEKNKFF